MVGDDIVEILALQEEAVYELLANRSELDVNGRRYASGKWTVKEVLGHLVDDERIFAYRMLCIARGDPSPLPSFDQDAYQRHVRFETHSLPELLAGYSAVRYGTRILLASLERDDWLRRGTVSEYSATVRGLAFHIAGHELRHLRSLRDRYFSGADRAD